MPDIDSSEPEAPQGAAEALAMVQGVRAALTKARDVELEHRRQTRKRVKDENAGLTPELKASRKRGQLAAASQRYRDRKAGERRVTKAVLPARPTRLPLSRAQLMTALLPLDRWLRQPGPAQRMIAQRNNQKRYTLGAAVMLMMRHDDGTDPAPVAFAARLAKDAKIEMSRIDAAHLLRQLRKIEGATGPWLASMTPSDETMTQPDETSRKCMTGADETSPNSMTPGDETSRMCMTQSDETSPNFIGGDLSGRRYA